jgi:hypothetical protein
MKSFAVTLDSPAKLSNGTLLEAGNYTMKIPENTQSPEVEFYKEGKLVAKVPAEVKTEPQKNPYTEIELNKMGDINVITAVDPNGWPERLILGTPGG